MEKKCNEAIERAVKIWVEVDVQQEGYIKQSASGVRENRGIPSDYTDVSDNFAAFPGGQMEEIR